MSDLQIPHPEPRPFNPLMFMAEELTRELRQVGRPSPPGSVRPSIDATQRMARDPLSLLLERYERHGPVFELRVLQHRMVWAVGAEANAFVVLEHPELFHWREGHFGQLIPLLGDGILTTDEAYHDRARRLMMPAFHHRQIEGYAETMVDEATRRSADWRQGDVVDVYAWARVTALRIAQRALLGVDPDGSEAMAAHFERALHYYGTAPLPRMLRGPRTPWAGMLAARKQLHAQIHALIARRRAEGYAERADVLSALLRASDEYDDGFSDAEIRDQLITLLFAGHDTSTSTLAFLLYELGRHPEERAAVLAEQDAVLSGSAPAAAALDGKTLPVLERALEETLRKYPPVWVGARRALTDCEICGVPVREGSYLQLGYWATHHLPELFEDPEAFRTARFEPDARGALPRGAYMPFGGGSRICIGKRFGQTVARAVASVLLAGPPLTSPAGFELRLKQEPTLSPRDGMPLVIGPR